MVNFPIFWTNHTECLEFSEYLAHKMLELYIFEENPEYSGSLKQLLANLAFCLVNIPIFQNPLHQVQIIIPK